MWPCAFTGKLTNLLLALSICASFSVSNVCQNNIVDPSTLLCFSLLCVFPSMFSSFEIYCVFKHAGTSLRRRKHVLEKHPWLTPCITVVAFIMIFVELTLQYLGLTGKMGRTSTLIPVIYNASMTIIVGGILTVVSDPVNTTIFSLAVCTHNLLLTM